MKRTRLSSNLKKLIHGKCQVDIAKRIKVPTSTLNDWITGDVYRPKSNGFARLARYFKTDTTTLLKGKV
jgi:hypothetical protein